MNQFAICLAGRTGFMTPQQLYAKLELIPADQFPLDRPKLHHFGSQLQRLKQQASHRLQSVFSYFCGSR
ncbi:MAG: hypothetical protein ACPGVO_14960, partial [Spirulinaceae cyanobacterium]